MRMVNLLEPARCHGILYIDLYDIKNKYKTNKKNMQKALSREGYSTLTVHNKLYYISKNYKYKLNNLKGHKL